MGTEDGCVVLFEITPTGVEYHRTLDRQEGRFCLRSPPQGSSTTEHLTDKKVGFV